VKHRGSSSSQLAGVSWHKYTNKWQAGCKGTHLGYHATEEDAVRAYNKYLKDGIDPVKHRDAITSQFTGVSWAKNVNKWRAQCRGRNMGCHATEEGAARAYNVEAERLGIALNVISPAASACAGPWCGRGGGHQACARGRGRGARSRRGCDYGGTLDEQEDQVEVGDLGGCGGRERLHGSACSERNWMLGSQRSEGT
jgi:hypothetical protein